MNNQDPAAGFDLAGFDQTDQGQAVVALLRRHAPPPTNPHNAAALVLARLPRARRVNLRALLPVATAAAAAVVAAVLIFTSRATPLDPGALPKISPVADVVYAPGPGLEVVVRDAAGEGWRVDGGLKDGLRVGDVLLAKGLRARVVAAGIFDSRVQFETGTPRRGDRLRTEAWTAPMERAAKYDSFGGDPGALLDFGAVFAQLPVHEARSHGLTDGKAIRVEEVIRTVLRDMNGQPEVTLATQLGLQRGDILIRVNNAPAGTPNDLASALGYARRGTVTATVLREGRTVELAAR